MPYQKDIPAKGGSGNPGWNFTLVELLFVVSIIAMLTALLLPALGKARQSVIRIACVSNMRQIGSATFLYGSDNDGRILTPGRPSGCINQYLQQQHAAATSNYNATLAFILPSLYVCPAITKANASPCWQGGVEAKMYFPTYVSTYKQQNTQARHGGWISSDLSGSVDRCPKLEQLKTDSILMGEKNYAGNTAADDSGSNYSELLYQGGFTDSSKVPPTSIYSHGWNHLGKSSNVLFLDNHVSTLRYTGQSLYDADFVLK